ncbi:guanine nucleotide-binding protein subunit alpha-13-like [Babylonia areolata]|uniref:guanine nucleotide-binding protein subunit alpha-13-like n=1 Tax=Babylonia areolata TaxID=304850 RepID=UPI003FD43272
MASLLACLCLDDDEIRQRNKSRSIDKGLTKERSNFNRTVRILLLGAGESGKSTFLKQMQIIHGQEFSRDELLVFRTTVYSNIVKGMRVLIDARQKLEIPWVDNQLNTDGTYIFSIDPTRKLDFITFSQYAVSIRKLWQDGGIREAFDRRREFQLGDSLPYYMDNLDRISAEDYVPTKQDILYSRKATKGISEHLISVKGIPFLFIDVGGQRSQRQKWYQCFQDVTSILFLAAASEFDQVLVEDRATNRLLESCDIFDTIINNKSFVNVSIILFLNKMDLLETKIKTISIADYFPAFTGNPRDIDVVKAFELKLFNSRCRDTEKPLFHHFTTAVDTENIKHVFQDVKDTILHDNLRSLMLD